MTHCPHCGSVLSKPRSYPQLKRYFALIRACWHHWPEAHERQFTSSEECRKWLEMKAGHREIGAQIPLSGLSKERAMLLVEAALRGVGSMAVPVLHGDTLVIFKPKSISFNKLSHKAACSLFDEVAHVIETETGMKADDLLASEAAQEDAA